jgi:hypothetical protein
MVASANSALVPFFGSVAGFFVKTKLAGCRLKRFPKTSESAGDRFD